MIVERSKVISYLLNNPFTPLFLINVENEIIFKFLYKKGKHFEFTDYRLDRETDPPHKVPLDLLNNNMFWNQGDSVMTFEDIKMMVDNSTSSSNE